MKEHIGQRGWKVHLRVLPAPVCRAIAHAVACEECRRELGLALRGELEDSHEADGKAGEIDFSDAFAAAQAALPEARRRILAEREAARATVDIVVSRPNGLVRMLETKGMARPEIAEELLQRGYDAASAGHVLEAEALGRGAAGIVERLDRDAYPGELVLSLETQCWTFLGVMAQLRGDRAEAEHAYTKACRAVRQVLGSYEEGTYCRFRAQMWKAEARVSDALALGARAARIFRELGEVELACGAIVEQTDMLLAIGCFEDAETLLWSALSSAEDGSEDLRLGLRLRLGVLLAMMGRYGEAAEVLGETDTDDLQDRRLGLQAGILHAAISGPWQEAEARIKKVLERLDDEEEMGLEGVLAWLVLASLYVREKRCEELRSIVGELRVFAKSLSGEVRSRVAAVCQSIERGDLRLEQLADLCEVVWLVQADRESWRDGGSSGVRH